MFIEIFLIALFVFFIIDIIWLGFVAKKLYDKQIGQLLKPKYNWTAAIIFYVIFVTGLVFFVIEPAIKKDSWEDALLLGAFFGFVCYATYDLTNLAVKKNWPLFITVVDLIWGTVLAASVSILTYLIATNLGI